MIPIIDEGPKLQQEDFAHVEGWLERRLPESFKDFYSVHNGGNVDNALDVPCMLSCFLPLLREDWEWDRKSEAMYRAMVDSCPACEGIRRETCISCR